MERLQRLAGMNSTSVPYGILYRRGFKCKLGLKERHILKRN